MILHTIVPPEIIMHQGAQTSAAEYRRESCGLVELARVDGELRVGRLISTDPKAYLDRRLQPGERIK